ncbi:MAG: DUF3500 domain-containing protein [Planctomycetia bacterium]|nr:DUF3500 domain-containing protein [Planctomycetia bacterium]
MAHSKRCPDCESGLPVDRRQFIKVAGTAAVATSVLPALVRGADEKPKPESLVKKLYDSMNDEQRKAVCFDWDYRDPQRGLLRTRVSNNWHITKPNIADAFYTNDQREIIRAIFEGLYNPEWVKKIEKQLQDDAGGYGKQQNIAIFGKPGEGKFELVMTGRHLTIRCDGNSADHVAFGGPIFYGHAASGFNEKVGHPGNVFWYQAVAANKVFEMLDGKQREKALVARRPQESSVAFRGPDGKYPGVPVADMTSDQKEQVQKTLQALIEPYREADQQEALACVKTQGGLDKCSLAFYQEGDLGDDEQWDNWRLEGPSFVWYFRGEPHVHVWVNIADDHKLELNA